MEAARMPIDESHVRGRANGVAHVRDVVRQDEWLMIRDRAMFASALLAAENYQRSASRGRAGMRLAASRSAAGSIVGYDRPGGGE
jgi:hypothetical protein